MTPQEYHGSPKSYIVGYILSIVLTILPLLLVLNSMVSTAPLILTILGIAVLQFIVQLYFFMHLKESGKWTQLTLITGIVLAITIVGGSAWVMSL